MYVLCLEAAAIQILSYMLDLLDQLNAVDCTIRRQKNTAILLCDKCC